jgi:hypothetical protein
VTVQVTGDWSQNGAIPEDSTCGFPCCAFSHRVTQLGSSGKLTFSSG